MSVKFNVSSLNLISMDDELRATVCSNQWKSLDWIRQMSDTIQSIPSRQWQTTNDTEFLREISLIEAISSDALFDLRTDSDMGQVVAIRCMVL
jgi:hypothetical protein